MGRCCSYNDASLQKVLNVGQAYFEILSKIDSTKKIRTKQCLHFSVKNSCSILEVWYRAGEFPMVSYEVES